MKITLTLLTAISHKNYVFILRNTFYFRLYNPFLLKCCQHTSYGNKSYDYNFKNVYASLFELLLFIRVPGSIFVLNP